MFTLNATDCAKSKLKRYSSPIFASDHQKLSLLNETLSIVRERFALLNAGLRSIKQSVREFLAAFRWMPLSLARAFNLFVTFLLKKQISRRQKSWIFYIFLPRLK